MKALPSFCLSAFMLASVSAAGGVEDVDRSSADYVRVQMPPGVQVILTEMEGPVFADATGHTLYTWPQQPMRIGFSGDPRGKSMCDNTPTLKTAGGPSPYPAGLDLPEADKRPSCAAAWPPFLALAGSQAVNQWSLVDRADGAKQWAYDGQPLYTSTTDRAPGDVNGGTSAPRDTIDTPMERKPIGPPANVPPGFGVISTVRGRMVVNERRYSVYVSDKDAPNKSNCFDRCANTWMPMAAPASAQAMGDWSIFQRAPGIRQWAYRKRPVYIFSEDSGPVSQEGADVPGWHNLYFQSGPKMPEEFTRQITYMGDVLADAQGRTIYTYSCFDDSVDQMSCDTPESPQAYRVAIAGGGNPERALQMWPYVVATAAAKSPSQTWSTIYIDPRTGHRSSAGQSGALRVWAWRGRPVYTYAGDKTPGDLEGNNTGEWAGRRNGFRAFFIRNLFDRSFG